MIPMRHKLHRLAERGRDDQETIYAIIDAALVCHVGFAEKGQPFVIPKTHARMGDRLVLHGSPANRLLKRIAGRHACRTGERPPYQHGNLMQARISI